MKIKQLFRIILVLLIVNFLVLHIFYNPVYRVTTRYYHDMDYSKDLYIDFWNDMWAECEFGEKNYGAVRIEYGVN